MNLMFSFNVLKMYAVYTTEIGSINVLSHVEKFILILSSKSIKMLISLGNVIANSIEKQALHAHPPTKLRYTFLLRKLGNTSG